MAGFLESFFDDNPSETFNLWSKDSDQIDASHDRTIFSGGLFKFSKAKGKWKQRHFVLTDKHLLYFKVE